jgi:hypothetical protein
VILAQSESQVTLPMQRVQLIGVDSQADEHILSHQQNQIQKTEIPVTEIFPSPEKIGLFDTLLKWATYSRSASNGMSDGSA